jgi:hypothetical protein
MRRRFARATGSIASVPLEVLNVAFVFFGGCAGLERAEVSAFSRLRIYFAGVQAILP